MADAPHVAGGDSRPRVHHMGSVRVTNSSGNYKGAIGNKVDLEEFLASGGDADGEAAGLYAGLPLLHAAVKYDDADVVRLLLKFGASKAKKDEAGKTAHDYAEELQSSAEMKALVREP